MRRTNWGWSCVKEVRVSSKQSWWKFGSNRYLLLQVLAYAARDTKVKIFNTIQISSLQLGCLQFFVIAMQSIKHKGEWRSDACITQKRLSKNQNSSRKFVPPHELKQNNTIETKELAVLLSKAVASVIWAPSAATPFPSNSFLKPKPFNVVMGFAKPSKVLSHEGFEF